MVSYWPNKYSTFRNNQDISPLYLCSYCLRRKDQLETSVRGFIKPIVVTTLIALLLFLEPDYGNTAILFSIAICILFIGGAKISQLAILTIIFFIFSLLQFISILKGSIEFYLLQILGMI